MARRIISFFLLGVGLIVLGCGGGGGGSSSTSGGSTGTSDIKPNVKVIPSDGSVQVDQSTPNQLVLNGPLPAIANGDVLTSTYGGQGFLRKVKGITRSRATGTVTVATEQATLEDVFNNAQIAVVKTLGYDDLSDSSRAVQDAPATRSRAINGAIHIDVPARTIASAGGINVVLDGALDVQYDLDTQFRISGLHVQTCKSVLTSRGASRLRLQGGFNGINIKVPIRTLSFKPYEVVVGNVLGLDVKIPITVEVGVYAVLRGDMSATFTATASAGATLQAGATYTDGNWSTTKSFNKTYDLTLDHTFDIGSTATLSPFAAEADVKIFDQVGAHFSLEPGFVGNYSRSSDPAGLNVSVSLGVTASASFHANILGANLEKDFPNFVNEQTAPFYTHFFADPPPNDTRTEVVVDDIQTAPNIDSVGFFKWGTSAYWWQVNGYGISGEMWYTYNSNPAVHPLNNVAQWRPNLTGSGNYEIYAYIPRNYATTHDANYEIYVNGAYVTTRHVDQSALFDQYASLGIYNLPAGGGSFVRVIDLTNETDSSKKIGVDAMKFTPR